MKNIRDEDSALKSTVTFSSDSAEINLTFCDHDDRTDTDEVPVKDILLIEVELNIKRVQFLKDDGLIRMFFHITLSKITMHCSESREIL